MLERELFENGSSKQIKDCDSQFDLRKHQITVD